MTDDKPTGSPDSSAQTLAAIGPIARSSVVDAVAERLRREILAERLPAGSRLPSERELSLALGVNRLTLRASLGQLEAQGLITTRHGAGSVVASWRERAGLDALALLVGSLTPQDDAWLELIASTLEIRRLLASEAIALAAARHTEEDLVAIEACRKELESHTHDAASFARADVAFMRAVVRAARNLGLELLLNTFARFPDELPQTIEALYDRLEESLPLYVVVVDMIKSGDGESARTNVRRALEIVDGERLARHAAKHAKVKPPSKRPRKSKGTKS
jgi:GntR family transcriptional repressor for pyruvate dehydrogenase complex